MTEIPPWLIIILTAMTPISELRGAIPLAMGVYNFNPLTAYTLGVMGNLIPVIPLLLFLEPVSRFLRRWPTWDRFFNWLFSRTYHNHTQSFEKYGSLALAAFVAIPLPITGAWTGCATAFVFGIKTRHALPAITAGILTSGAIVTSLTLAGIKLA